MLTAFFAALTELFARKPTASPMTSREWQAVAPVIRQRSFFSATIDKVRVLTTYQRTIADWMEGTVEEVDGPFGKQTAYKVGGAADFRQQASEYLVREGLVTPEELGDKSMRSIASTQRLDLVFNTNIEQVQTLTTWKSQTQDPDYINRFPAARFVRRPGATIKRPRHVAAENEVHRWDDFSFWLFQNAEDIGGFGVPWGPFGFNSYMVQQPVGRKEAERLGLVRPGEVIRPVNAATFGITPAAALAVNVKANLNTAPDAIQLQARAELRAQFGDSIFGPDGNPSLEFATQVSRDLKARIAARKAANGR